MSKEHITDEQILLTAEPFGAFQYGDAQGGKRIDFARAILALRPQAVPMTDEQIHDLATELELDDPRADLLLFAKQVEAHHGITTPKIVGT